MSKARLLFVLALLGLAAVSAAAAYAVQLTLNSDNITRVGGTGQVEVLSPDFNNTIESVVFIVDTNNPPYYITSVDITWEPAETGTYFIAINIYDVTVDPTTGTTQRTLIASGTQTVNVDGTQAAPQQSTTTRIQFPSPVNPADVDYVEIIIVQQTIQ